MPFDLNLHWQQRGPLWAASFTAMACPCELLFAGAGNPDSYQPLARCAINEIKRIEAKYSRFTPTGIIHTINNANGEAIALDQETAGLIRYAQQLYTLSDGLFDITSGALKNIWAFHQKNQTPHLPTTQELAEKLALIGFDKVQFSDTQIQLPAGVQLDVGGIGKEYAADRALQIVSPLLENARTGILINLGGDIVASPQPNEAPWRIGIRPHAIQAQSANGSDEAIALTHGAVTTSGTSERRWIIEGKTYSHILNPKTGWPVEDPPLAVTVAAPTCMQAGMLSTLIMLQGANAEAFIANEQIDCWLHR